jgi:hypothetical protein
MSAKRGQSATAVVQRVRGEFIEMPGLSLTLGQARRLFGLREDLCINILNALAAEGFIRQMHDGRYVRAADATRSLTA